MNSIWLPVAISLVAGFVYIWQSVSSQVKRASDELSSDKPPMWTLIFLIVTLCSVPIGYWYLGNLDKQTHWLAAQQKLQMIQQGQELNKDLNSIQDLILALRTSIDSEPNNGQLWFMLAESYFQLGMIDLADESISRALRIEMRADWLVANAQILSARSNDNDLVRTSSLLSQALLIEPNHHSALLTLGFIQLRQKQYEPAIKNWKKLEGLLKKAGNNTDRINKQIEFAEQQLAKTPK